MLITAKAGLAVMLALAGAAVGVLTVSFIVGRVLESRARKVMAPSCSAPGLAVEYGGWSGTSHELVFTSKAYMEAFKEANPTTRMSNARIVERFQEAGS
ncbi:MAG TPA: hypothetical protein VN493_31585 [Thermoanaerobaculia bacterium]|nr:hypothetical protein [Thermoanaerobaculia bacterium]